MDQYPPGLDPISVNIKKRDLISKAYQHWFPRICLLFSVFIYGYAYGLEGALRNVFQITAALALHNHSLSSTINVIRSVISAAVHPVYARLADTYGRFQLVVFLVILTLVGNIITSQATNIAYFCGGSAVYQVGLSGMMNTAHLIGQFDASVADGVCAYP